MRHGRGAHPRFARPRGDVVLVVLGVDERGRVERRHVARRLVIIEGLGGIDEAGHGVGLRVRPHPRIAPRAWMLAPEKRHGRRAGDGRVRKGRPLRHRARPPGGTRVVCGGRRSSGWGGGVRPDQRMAHQGGRLPHDRQLVVDVVVVVERLGQRDCAHPRDAPSRHRCAAARDRGDRGRYGPGHRGDVWPWGRHAAERARCHRARGRRGRRRLTGLERRRALRDELVELGRAQRRRAHQRAHLVIVLVVVRRVLVVEREQRARRRIGVPLLEGAPEGGGARRAQRAIALERVVEDALQIVVADVEDGERRRRGVRDALPRLGFGRAAERARPGERLVERRRDGPHVVAGRERAARDALGRLIRDAARRLAQVGQDGLRGAVDGRREHALGRDGAVRDAEGVQRLNPLREADGPAHGVELVQRAIARDPSCKRFHLRSQRSTGPRKFVPGSACSSRPGRPIPGCTSRSARSGRRRSGGGPADAGRAAGLLTAARPRRRRSGRCGPSAPSGRRRPSPRACSPRTRRARRPRAGARAGPACSRRPSRRSSPRAAG